MNLTPQRRFGNWAVIAAFLLGIGLPLVDHWLKFDETPLIENRQLAAKPAPPTELEGVPTYIAAFDAYWRDNFGFRRQLIRWYAIARHQLGVSLSPRVLIGKGGTLFYTGEDAIPAFRGLLELRENTIERWAQELEARRAYLERRGIKYLFVIAPNKETVVPELVPGRFTRVAPTPLDRLLWYLAINHSKVDVLDLRGPLQAGKAEGPVFFRTDTHWNDHGSYVTYTALMNRLRPWLPTLRPRPKTSFMRRTGRPVSGDLAAMLGLTDVLTEPLQEWVPAQPAAAQEIKPDLPQPVESRRLRVMLGRPGLPRAVVLHDSFFLAPDERGEPGRAVRTDPFMPRNSAFRLSALIAENFSRSVFSWQHTLDTSMIARERPAVVVQEIVERSIPAGPIGQTPPN
jgi:hypothetical protein